MDFLSNDFTMPMCAVCKRPVEKITSEYLFMSGKTVYTLYCHGATERVEIPDRVLLDMIGISFSGEAFSQKMLDKPESV